MSTLARTSPPATTSPLRHLISCHPLVAFFVIAFAGSWIAWLPLILAQNGLGLLPYTIPNLIYPPSYWCAALSSITGPTLACFVVTAISAGKAGIRQLLRRYVLWRVGLRWYLLLFIGVPVIQLACAGVFLGIAPLTAFIQQWPLYFTVYLPNILVISVAIQIWEEGGWSGFIIPNLQKRFGAWRATLIFGPLWALFHLPAFFVPGQIFDQKVGPITMIVQMTLLIILAIPTRMIMTWIFNNTRGSILIAIILHSALDASNSGSDFIRRLLPTSQLGGYALGASLLLPLVAAALLLILTRGRLSSKPERLLAESETRPQGQPGDSSDRNAATNS